MANVNYVIECKEANISKSYFISSFCYANFKTDGFDFTSTCRKEDAATMEFSAAKILAAALNSQWGANGKLLFTAIHIDCVED